MRHTWTRDLLTRRIDRCYLIAAGTKVMVKRLTYLQLARYYRTMLASMAAPGHQLQTALA